MSVCLSAFDACCWEAYLRGATKGCPECGFVFQERQLWLRDEVQAYRLTVAELRARRSTSEAEEATVTETQAGETRLLLSPEEQATLKAGGTVELAGGLKLRLAPQQPLEQQLAELQASLDKQGERIAQFRALADRVEQLTNRLGAVEQGYVSVPLSDPENP